MGRRCCIFFPFYPWQGLSFSIKISMYFSIALLTPPFATLTYALPSWWPKENTHILQRGLRVAIPLGKSLRVGVLLEVQTHTPDLPLGVDIKPFSFILEKAPLLDAHYLDMVQQLSLRQYRSQGDILGHMLPTGLRSTKITIRHFEETKPKKYSLKATCALQDHEKATLIAALINGRADFLLPKHDAAESEVCQLLVEPPWPVRPMAKKQIAILEYLLDAGNHPTRRQVLKHVGDGAAQSLATLIKNGHVALCPTDIEEDIFAKDLLPPLESETPQTFTFSIAQEKALDAFAKALDAPPHTAAQNHVLFGVTGSGKTAVYLALTQMCYQRGKSMLLLAPEVALTHKLYRDACIALPHIDIFLYHGYQSAARREKLFRELSQRQSPCLIIGSRSALFLPIPQLGAIVLDEEHDGSFKQDEKLIYHAKEVAHFRIAQQKGLLVLGSATPDIKTYHAVKEGHLHVHSLPERVGGGTLPSITLIDIAGKSGHASLLAPESEMALKETLAKGEQAVILLNRRGYAPLMYCLDCQKVARCPHCEIGLTYHKGREKLICHYCGHSVSFPVVCPHCKGMHYLPMGEGTEKIAEHVGSLLNTTVLRLDKDSTRKQGRMEEILEAFAKQEASVLVGTQMLSKGHHFPNVTLALIADADLGLNLPDYRAAERTFQLLVQSAGRAGRGAKPGRVLIQTRDVHHYCWKYIQQADYESFYEDEIARRQKRLYPPFVRLALIRISHALDISEGTHMVKELGAHLRKIAKESNVTVLGPAPAPLTLLRGQKRYHCLIKSQDWHTIRTTYAKMLQCINRKILRVSLDLDPINML